jgi:O-antigen ligase
MLESSAKKPACLAIGLSLYAACSLVSMAVMSIGIAFALMGLVIGYGGPRRLGDALKNAWNERPFRIYFYLATVLALACFASLVGAKLFPLGYGGHFVEVSFGKDMAKAWYLFWPLPLAVGLLGLGPSHRGWVLRVWLGAFLVLSLIGISQFFTGWPRPQVIPTLEHRFHATLFLGHHLSVASIFIFPFFVAVDLLRSRGRANFFGVSRGFLVAAVLAGGTCLILGYSRALWAALPLGLLAWAVWSLPRRWAITSLFTLALIAAAALQTQAVRRRLFDDVGVSQRTELWMANLSFFKARPLTGSGWHHNLELSGYYLVEKYPSASFIFTGHAHNNALEMLGGMGLLGLLAWLAWTFGILGLLWPFARDPRSMTFARGIVCAWLVFQINGLTQVNFWESKVMHQMAWMVAWSLAWAMRAPEKA